MLYIVSTPIGNLGDITIRAIETLKAVALIAAEDTRHTRILLNHYDIKTPLISYYEQNQFKRGEELIRQLLEGKDIALVTDAGTPGISDPGYQLVRLAWQNKVAVTAVPGASALITALSLSSLPCHNFIFEGFLPVKSQSRRNKLASLSEEKRTVIFYESPYRLLKALSDIAVVLPEAEVVVARELTKKFEELLRGTAAQLLEHFTKHPPKGEFVVLLNLAAGKCLSPEPLPEEEAPDEPV